MVDFLQAKPSQWRPHNQRCAATAAMFYYAKSWQGPILPTLSPVMALRLVISHSFTNPIPGIKFC